MPTLSGIMLHRAAALPCPIEPAAALGCRRLRRVSSALFWSAVCAYAVGSGFVLATSLW
jgi:hypothetical protein